MSRLDQLLQNHMLNLDAPDHTRLRKLVSKTFTIRRINDLAPRTQEIADALIDPIQAQGYMDLIDDFAVPLPITVISEMLGVPPEDRPLFSRASAMFIAPETFENSMLEYGPVMREFIDYLTNIFAQRRQEPKDDLISALLQVEEEGEQLSEAEMYSMVVLLMVAGHETTANLIGNGLLALMEYPEQRVLLEREPERIDAFVEEILRHNGPAERVTMRYAAEDTELAGKLIRRGERVTVVAGAANRDPKQFANPDQFNMTRTDNKHMGFGYGVHYCVGAPLARMEAKIAVQTLLRRLPNLRLADHAYNADEGILWNTGILVRGMVRMPVVWD
ncbi:MAG: cytochrome P450 [Chloroflexota bacterium]